MAHAFDIKRGETSVFSWKNNSSLCFFCLLFVMPLWASVYLCLVVTCWERADLLALVFGV